MKNQHSTPNTTATTSNTHDSLLQFMRASFWCQACRFIGSISALCQQGVVSTIGLGFAFRVHRPITTGSFYSFAVPVEISSRKRSNSDAGDKRTSGELDCGRRGPSTFLIYVHFGGR